MDRTERDRPRRPDADARRPRRGDNDFQAAMRRLEDALAELGSSAGSGLSERAASLLEQTADRLRDRRDETDDALYDRYGDDADEDLRSGRLRHWRSEHDPRPVRDLANKRIWGICSGIAPYLGLQTWVVRCLAVTGLVFMPQVVVPAYIVGYFVLDEVNGPAGGKRYRRRANRRAARRQAKAQRREARRSARAERRGSTVTPAGPPPSATLRSVSGLMNEAELRLRRMEGHVTSGRFELQRELRKIDA